MLFIHLHETIIFTGFIWTCHLVCYAEERTWIKDVLEQGAEEKFWVWGGGSKDRVEKTA
jgi:hypothetical protein